MLVRLGAVVLILAAVFGALGCGTNLDTYNRTMDAWTDDLNAMPAFPQVQHDQQGLPYFDDSESGARLQASTGALAELEKIKPPRQIAQEHQRLVEAYRVWFQLERQFVAAAAVHDFATTKRVEQSLKNQQNELDDALAQIGRAIEGAR